MIGWMSCLLNLNRFKLCFDSVIDKYLVGIKDKFKDPELADLFESCYPNTLDTTVYSFTDNPEGDEDTFLITGDITAMWLRDSTNQVRFGR